MGACKAVKCKDCKYWQMEDELPGISEFMECTRIDENDPDWWKKYHFRGPEDSCEYGKGSKTGWLSIMLDAVHLVFTPER
jgi:hypothetical protein